MIRRVGDVVVKAPASEPVPPSTAVEAQVDEAAVREAARRIQVDGGKLDHGGATSSLTALRRDERPTTELAGVPARGVRPSARALERARRVDEHLGGEAFVHAARFEVSPAALAELVRSEADTHAVIAEALGVERPQLHVAAAAAPAEGLLGEGAPDGVRAALHELLPHDATHVFGLELPNEGTGIAAFDVGRGRVDILTLEGGLRIRNHVQKELARLVGKGDSDNDKALDWAMRHAKRFADVWDAAPALQRTVRMTWSIDREEAIAAIRAALEL